MSMNMKKICVSLGMATFLMLGSLANAQADNRQSDMVVYIDPVEYTNPINLWHPYTFFWFYQGPVVEKLTLEKLDQAYDQVSMCDASQSGKVLLWVKPKMFFNPQVQIFYGKITVNAYTGNGKHLKTYEAESAVNGRINIYAEKSIEKSYAVAIDSVVQKMQADSELQALLASKADQSSESTPCGMVTLIPTSKIRAMPF